MTGAKGGWRVFLMARKEDSTPIFLLLLRFFSDYTKTVV
jgi:hypothetical protein